MGPVSPTSVSVRAEVRKWHRVGRNGSSPYELETQDLRFEIPDLTSAICSAKMFGNRIAGKDQSADVDKWREEVADIHPENKAG